MIAHISHSLEQQSSSHGFVYYLVIRSCRCSCCSRSRCRHRQSCRHSFPLVNKIEPQFMCVWNHSPKYSIGKRALNISFSSLHPSNQNSEFPKFSKPSRGIVGFRRFFIILLQLISIMLRIVLYGIVSSAHMVDDIEYGLPVTRSTGSMHKRSPMIEECFDSEGIEYISVVRANAIFQPRIWPTHIHTHDAFDHQHHPDAKWCSRIGL